METLSDSLRNLGAPLCGNGGELGELGVRAQRQDPYTVLVLPEGREGVIRRVIDAPFILSTAPPDHLLPCCLFTPEAEQMSRQEILLPFLSQITWVSWAFKSNPTGPQRGQKGKKARTCPQELWTRCRPSGDEGNCRSRCLSCPRGFR